MLTQATVKARSTPTQPQQVDGAHEAGGVSLTLSAVFAVSVVASAAVVAFIRQHRPAGGHMIFEEEGEKPSMLEMRQYPTTTPT